MASVIAKLAIKLEVRAKLRKKGYSLKDTAWAMAALDDDLIDGVVASSGQAAALQAAEDAASGADPTPTPTPTPAPGAFAQIVAAIIAFLQSPQGQALISQLISLLIHALGG